MCSARWQRPEATSAHLLDGSDLMDGMEEVVDGLAALSHPANAAQGRHDTRRGYHTGIVPGEFEF